MSDMYVIICTDGQYIKVTRVSGHGGSRTVYAKTSHLNSADVWTAHGADEIIKEGHGIRKLKAKVTRKVQLI